MALRLLVAATTRVRLQDEGTVYRVTPSGAEVVLHSFTGGAGGSLPVAPLVQGIDGNFYTTTESGGASQSGSLVKITPTGTVTTVYSFNSGPEGQSPIGLTQASDGNLYGTTSQGGASGNGTLFEIRSSGVGFVLYSFAGGATDGSNPDVVILGRDGNFYGTARAGGKGGQGTIFKF